MLLLKRIINGCRDLPGFGPHPGTLLLFIMAAVGGLAGIDKGGVNGFIGGSLFAFLMTLPLYLIGAYSRGRLYDESKQRLMRTIKDA